MSRLRIFLVGAGTQMLLEEATLCRLGALGPSTPRNEPGSPDLGNARRLASQSVPERVEAMRFSEGEGNSGATPSAASAGP